MTVTKREFSRKGKNYIAERKGDNVHVTVEKTAKGQNIELGHYNIRNNSWHGSRNDGIPSIVKKGVEVSFGEATA